MDRNNLTISTTPKNIKYILVKMPNIESCTISIMIKTGSIYESKELRGGAHLIEHMLFKGNKVYKTQSDISDKLDSLGARYNAYTDTNIVSFHIKIQKSHFLTALNILADMLTESFLRPEDIKGEKDVVIEELEKDSDLPASKVFELFNKIVYRGCNYSKSVGGSKKSVLNIKADKLKDFWKEEYNKNNIVVSIAGDFTEEFIKDRIDKSSLGNILVDGKLNDYSTPPRPQKNIRYLTEHKSEMSQSQICLGFPSFSNKNNDKYALELIKTILAGPMSSRLFKIMRNKYGIAYHVVAMTDYNSVAGNFVVTSGVNNSGMFTNKLGSGKTKADPIKVILDEIFKLAKDGVNEGEVKKAKEYIKGNIILDIEDSEYLSQFYGKQSIVEDEIKTIREYIQYLDRVTSKDILRVARKVFLPNKINFTMISNLKKNSEELDNYFLEIQESYSKYAF